MKRKIIGILIITLLITTTYNSLGLEENISSSLNNSIEIEDQHNEPGDWEFRFNGTSMEYWEDYIPAQGFTPNHTPLSKLTLYIFQYGTPPKDTHITVSIRANLDGNDILSDTINLDEVTTLPRIDFVFSDTYLTIGKMYYFVCSVDKGTHDNCYAWGASSFDTYEKGDCWIFVDGKWIEGFWGVIPVDFAFKTFFRDYAPDSCEIDGPTEGKSQEFTDYTFCTKDPEGHDVEYYIEWGDGFELKWIGPFESGETVTQYHSWASKGNYIIRVKARDTYGAEGDWTELEVSMSKTKEIITPFLAFLENHPHLFPLIIQILELI
jgi:hypothetical protein